MMGGPNMMGPDGMPPNSSSMGPGGPYMGPGGPNMGPPGNMGPGGMGHNGPPGSMGPGGPPPGMMGPRGPMMVSIYCCIFKREIKVERFLRN